MESNVTELTLYNELMDLFSIQSNNVEIKLDPNVKKTKLVLSGGGIKGVAHLGALKALQELGMLQHIDTFVGTSSGALVASLLSIGYTPDELYKFISMVDMSKMKELSFGNLLKLLGLDDGKRMEIVIEKLFKGKNPGKS